MLPILPLLLTALSSALAIESPQPTVHPSRLDTPTAPPLPSTTLAPTGTFTTTQLIVLPGQTGSYFTKHPQTITLALPTCIQTITPDANGHVPPGTCGAIWNYYPSFAAAVAFTVAFAVLCAVHVWLAMRYRKAWCWVIIMATIWEAAALLFRAVSAKMQQSEGVYLVFQICILLAPVWVNAFAYMVLSHMVHFFSPERSILGIPATAISAIFVAFDLVAFIVQLVGGGMASPSAPPEAQQRAIHIYMGGIAFQQFVIVGFVGLCVAFQRRLVTLDKSAAGGGGGGDGVQGGWRGLLWVVYAALAMITVRIIYRLVEFSDGVEEGNVLVENEVYFYLLEVLPMLCALAGFAVWHPGRFMDGPAADMPGLLGLLKDKLLRRRARSDKFEVLDDGDDFHTDRHELVAGRPSR